VGLVRTDISEEYIASIIRVTRIGVLGTALAVISNRSMLNLVFHRSLLRLLVATNVIPNSPILVSLMMKAIHSSETRFLQNPRGVTSQKIAIFSKDSLYIIITCLMVFLAKNGTYFCFVVSSILFNALVTYSVSQNS
jgi:hypothetical protein